MMQYDSPNYIYDFTHLFSHIFHIFINIFTSTLTKALPVISIWNKPFFWYLELCFPVKRCHDSLSLSLANQWEWWDGLFDLQCVDQEPKSLFFNNRKQPRAFCHEYIVLIGISVALMLVWSEASNLLVSVVQSWNSHFHSHRTNRSFLLWYQFTDGIIMILISLLTSLALSVSGASFHSNQQHLVQMLVVMCRSMKLLSHRCVQGFYIQKCLTHTCIR